ncbi:MAG: hypothetical protein Q9170_004035 [Blastenia crenularia]
MLRVACCGVLGKQLTYAHSASIATPLLSVANDLGLPPYPTLAGQNLWNYRLIDPSQSISEPSNLLAQFTFTGTDHESWFYVVLAAMEARGAPVICLALHAFQAVDEDDGLTLIEHLDQIAIHLKDLSIALPRMYERCDPDVFYNRIRPFLTGSKPSTKMPHGVFYEDEHGGGTWQQCNGPTAAQSSLWQFIDLALGVRHLPTGVVAKAPGDFAEHPALSGKSVEFLEQMREYMPGPHRRFLQRVAKEANIRAYVKSHPTNMDLQAAYNRCLDCLVAFRNKHVQIISRYIVVPSRKAQQSTLVMNNHQGDNKVSKEAKTAVTGTGGTSPVVFLKQVRDETVSSVLRA